jgi:hypothetical protein
MRLSAAHLSDLLRTINTGRNRVVVRIDRLDQNLIVDIPLTFLRRL